MMFLERIEVPEAIVPISCNGILVPSGAVKVHDALDDSHVYHICSNCTDDSRVHLGPVSSLMSKTSQV